MYNNKFVACLVVNGKIAREIGETVYMPFGSEYAIRLKNLDTRRAVVSVTIDGEDATGGTQLVIEANQESDLEGFLDAATNVARNRFKFIEKTQKISEHRGDRADDGLIRIEFQFEEPPYVPPYRPNILRKSSPPWSDGFYCMGLGDPTFSSNAAHDSGPRCLADSGEGVAAMDFLSDQNETFNDQGITVAGSVVNQKFGTTHVGRLDPTKHVIVFQLKGEKSNGQKVAAPLLSRAKVTCPTCGTKNSSGNKFCPECSTALI